MLFSRAGDRPAKGRFVGVHARLAALVCALALGACSSAGPTTQSLNWFASAETAADVPPPAVAGPAVEVEGDGLEGQRPPRRRASQMPDDPREPFSPNYGSMPTADLPAPAPA